MREGSGETRKTPQEQRSSAAAVGSASDSHWPEGGRRIECAADWEAWSVTMNLADYQPEDCDILIFRRWKSLLNHAAIVFMEQMPQPNNRSWIDPGIKRYPRVYEAFPPKAHRLWLSEYADGRFRSWLFDGSELEVWRYQDMQEDARRILRLTCVVQLGTPYSWWLNFALKLPGWTDCVEFLGVAQIEAFGAVYGDTEPSRITPGLFREVSLGLGWEVLG